MCRYTCRRVYLFPALCQTLLCRVLCRGWSIANTGVETSFESQPILFLFTHGESLSKSRQCAHMYGSYVQYRCTCLPHSLYPDHVHGSYLLQLQDCHETVSRACEEEVERCRVSGRKDDELGEGSQEWWE